MGAAWKTVDEDYQLVGVYTGQTAKFGVNTTPPDITPPDGFFKWGGIASGNKFESDVTFTTPNELSEDLTVKMDSVTKTAKVAIRNRPEGVGEYEYAFVDHPGTSIVLFRHNIISNNGGNTEPSTWAAAAYPGNQGHNGKGDAARHAYWTCLMTRYGNPEYALGLSMAHEVSAQPSPSTETVMDLYNDDRGVEIARNHVHVTGQAGVDDFQCCRDAVQTAINNGTLWYLDSSWGTANQNEDALLQPTNK